MADYPSVQTACANCQKPAIQACSGCKEAPALGGIPVEKISYCSTECQKKDWVIHKKLCKRLQLRKVFYRAGDTLQKIFYVYREKVFDKLIAKVEKKNGKLYIHEGYYPPMVTEYDFIQPFP